MTPEKQATDTESIEFLASLKQSSLNDYPNPERNDCPGPEFLKALATNRKSIPIDDPRGRHVVYCSPCFQEFTKLGEAAAKRPGQLKIIFAMAAIVLVTVAMTWAWKHSSKPVAAVTQIAEVHGALPIVAEISLENRSVARGDSGPSDENTVLRVPRGHLKLTILLPFTSPEGMYDMQILKEVDKPLMSLSGRAVLVAGITKLNLDIDTSTLAAGKYLLGIRYAHLDWSFNTIMVE